MEFGLFRTMWTVGNREVSVLYHEILISDNGPKYVVMNLSPFVTTGVSAT